MRGSSLLNPEPGNLFIVEPFNPSTLGMSLPYSAHRGLRLKMFSQGMGASADFESLGLLAHWRAPAPAILLLQPVHTSSKAWVGSGVGYSSTWDCSCPGSGAVCSFFPALCLNPKALDFWAFWQLYGFHQCHHNPCPWQSPCICVPSVRVRDPCHSVSQAACALWSLLHR